MKFTKRSFDKNKLKLGFFGINCSGGLSATLVPERWKGTWEQNREAAELADEAGLDFLLPLGRWRGYGGQTDHNGEAIETLTWASGLLSITKKIITFGTVHVPLFNPIVAAKQMASADQIGQGRFGLNIVCGWNEKEFEMAGIVLNKHTRRYEQGQEWVDIIKRAWAEKEAFDYDGEFYQVKGVMAKPKLYQGETPLMVCAANSPTGREFASRNCDMMFTSIKTKQDQIASDIGSLKQIAKKYGRQLGVFTNCYVVCRPTRKEAEEYHDYYTLEMGDKEATRNLVEGRNVRGRFDDLPEFMLSNLEQRAAGGNGAYPIIGNPDDVANLLIRLHKQGIDAFAMGFVNYILHFPYFRDEVLPRLVKAGFRVEPN